MITHDAARRAGLDHVAHDQQCLADARTTVDDVTEKQRLSLRMAPHPTYPRITHLLQQLLERMRAAMHISDDVIALPELDVCHSAYSVRRLLQPSLLRQIA